MIMVKCSRSGCQVEKELPAIGLSIVVPPGWHHHVDDNGRATFHCCDDCFSLWWEQRRWRKQERRGMAPLEVAEETLLPKG